MPPRRHSYYTPLVLVAVVAIVMLSMTAWVTFRQRKAADQLREDLLRLERDLSDLTHRDL